MRTYETTILVKATPARTDYDGTVAAVRALYESEGVQFSEFAKWEERKLAYPIASETHAMYFTAYFTADPLAIDRIDRRVQLNELVLRHLIIAREGPALERIKAQRIKQAEAAAAAAAAALIEEPSY
jgi:small subunit ribosomal protein S6